MVSDLRVGEGVEEDGGEGATEACGSTLKSVGIAGRAGRRGVCGGGGFGLGNTSSTAAATESDHRYKG